MVLGVDPSFVLDTPAEDLPIVEAVLKRAGEIRAEYDGELAKAIGRNTANELLPGLTKNMNRTIVAIARLMNQ